jgi:DNA-binding GntR family transcriptional regulator
VNGEVHVRLAGMTGNALLERCLSDVVTRCSLILAVYGRPHSPDCACSEHRSLISALRQRDAEGAVRLMGEHLAGIERRALIAELPREGHALGDVLARCREQVAPPATPLPITRRRTA